MDQNISCPTCHTFIEKDQWGEVIMVCRCCGTIVPHFKGKKKKDPVLGAFLKVSVGLAVVASLLFVFTAKWGDYSWQILSLQSKDFIGLATEDDLLKMVSICEKRHQPKCIEHLYRELTLRYSQKVQYFADYAYTLIDNKKPLMAGQAFHSYFRGGGNNSKAAVDYAQLLETQAQYSAAEYYYRLALRVPSGSKLPIMRSYIKLLMKAKKYEKAKSLILAYRRKEKKYGALFMNPQLRQITQILARNR